MKSDVRAARRSRVFDGRGLTSILAVVCLGWTCVPNEARAENGRITIIEENDAFQPNETDLHYTQGVMFSYLSPTLTANAFPANLYAPLSTLSVFQAGPDTQRKFDVVFGQSIFTPKIDHNPVPNPNDRPYAGWLYGGGSLLQETNGRMLENFEVLVGVIGPDSLARQAQESVHSLLGLNQTNASAAWSHQLKNEPGLMITYDRHWKVWQRSFLGFETEVIPEAGITAGNVLTYADAGVQFRVGQNLGADYGVPRVRPSMSGTNWFNAAAMTSPFGWYLFAGVQGRAVARNIFLDGNTFVDSPSVDKKVLVADISGGASVFYKDWAKLDFTFTERTKEFTTQQAMDRFGTIALSFRF